MLVAASDEKLVRRALAGSNAAWTALVKRYERRVYNHALRMVGHPDDALDLMQEVFLGVYRNLATYRGDGVFPAWLFRIATFRARDLLRRRRDWAPYEDGAAEARPDNDPVQAAEAHHANREIQAALATLPAAQRQVIELKFFQQFTFDDIAAQLGISPNTAKTRLYSALRKLRMRECLRDEL